MTLWRSPTAANRISAPRARFRRPCCGDWLAPQLTVVAPDHPAQQTCLWCQELETWKLSERATSN